MAKELKRVLVVETDEILQLTLRELLQDEGYQVEIATGHRAALDALQRALPVAMLIDMDLRHADSKALVGDVRTKYGRQVPIVLLGPRYEVAALAQTVGADASLAIPFDLDDLYNVVARFASTPSNNP